MRIYTKISENTKSNVCTLFLVLVLFLLPFSVRLSGLAIVGLAAFWILLPDYQQKFERVRDNWSKIKWIIFYFFILAFSILYSEEKLEGWFLLEKRLSLLAFPLILATTTFTQKQLRLIGASFIFSTFLVTLVGLSRTYSHYLDNQASNTSFHLNYYQWIFPKFIDFHAPYLAIYLSLAGLSSIWWCILGNNLKIKLLSIILALFFNLTLAFTASRTAITVNLFLVFIILAQFLINKRQYLTLTFCFILIFLSSYFLIDSLPYLKNKLLSGTGGSERWQLWKSAFIAWKSAPIFGFGIGDASKNLETVFTSLGYTVSFGHNFDPHNQYISTALKAGIVGLASLFLMLIVPFLKELRKGHLLNPSIILLFSGCFFTESVLSAQKGIVIFAFLYSLFILHPLEPANE